MRCPALMCCTRGNRRFSVKNSVNLATMSFAAAGLSDAFRGRVLFAVFAGFEPRCCSPCSACSAEASSAASPFPACSVASQDVSEGGVAAALGACSAAASSAASPYPARSVASQGVSGGGVAAPLGSAASVTYAASSALLGGKAKCTRKYVVHKSRVKS